MKVLAQGISSASNISNPLTDRYTRFASQMLKNMDNLLIFGDSLKKVKEKVEEFLIFAKKKNLILKTSKSTISEDMELGGSVVSVDMD